MQVKKSLTPCGKRQSATYASEKNTESMSSDQHNERRSLLRAAGIMTLMTLLSRVLGLVREQVRGHFLGTGYASDAFGIATLVPNLFRRLLAEGAMTASFLPIFVEYLRSDNVQAMREFLSRFVTLLSCIVAGVVVVGALCTPYLVELFFSDQSHALDDKVKLTVALMELMWPYLWFVSIAAVLQAILNAHKIFGPSAFTPVLLNLAIIGCGIGLSESLPNPAYGLIAGFLVGGLVQVLFQIPYLLRRTKVRLRLDFRFNHPGVKRVLTQMVPGVFAAGVYQINVFISQLIAASLQEGSVAALQFSIRLQELVLGLFVVSVAQVALPTLSEHTAANNTKAVKDTLRYTTRLMAYVTLPATAGLILVGVPVVRLLFEFGEFDANSTAMTSFALVFHATGLFAIASTRVTQQVLYAYKDLKTPTIIAAIVTALNIALCLILAGPLAHGGIALAGSVAAAFNAVLLLWVLKRRLGDLGFRLLGAPLLKYGIATGVMTGCVLAIQSLWPHESITHRLTLAGWVALVVVVAVAVYMIACRLMGVDELKGLLKRGNHKNTGN